MEMFCFVFDKSINEQFCEILTVRLCFARYSKINKEEGEGSSTHLARESFQGSINLECTGDSWLLLLVVFIGLFVVVVVFPRPSYTLIMTLIIKGS